MKTRLPQVIIDAQNNWPEDEASITATTYKERLENESSDDKFAEELLHRDVAHMHKVFSFEDDANELVTRYNTALLEAGIDVKKWLF